MRIGSPCITVFFGCFLGASGCSTDVSEPTTDAPARHYQAAMAAHHLCSGSFVVGRDYRRSPEEVLEQDLAAFPVFDWQDEFEYEVDATRKTATVRGPGIDPQTARYNGDQGCSILLLGKDNVSYRPVEVPRSLPDPSTQNWPTGDVGAMEPVPDGIDMAALTEALDWAMEQPQNTRALVVAYKGKVLGERYASGFTKNTPQISWSQGKSITAALIGVLVHKGHLSLDDSAPVTEWQQPEDPRSKIKIRDGWSS